MSSESQTTSVVHSVGGMDRFVMLADKDDGPSRRFVYQRDGDGGWEQEEQIEEDGQWKSLGSVELDHIQFAGPIDD